MKVALFGATGRTGRHLVEQALAHGHEVTAFVRNPSSLPSRDRLVPFQGDVLNPAQVEAAVRGQDAVISALGGARKLKNSHSTQGPLYIRTIGTEHILTAMQKHGMRRFVCQSAYGASDSRTRSLYVMVAWLLAKDGFEDTERQERLIQQSPLDWTIVRPSRLTDERWRGIYRVGVGLRLGPLARISRADVAEFIVKQLTDNTYIRKAAAISY